MNAITTYIFLGLKHKVLPKPFVAGKQGTAVLPPAAQKAEVEGSLEPRNKNLDNLTTPYESCKNGLLLIGS